MAACMVIRIRALCRNVYVLRRNCHTLVSKIHCEHSTSSISGSFLTRTSTGCHCRAVTSLSTSRAFQTHTDSQDKEEVEETRGPDHPLPNIEDPFKEPVEPCILCKNKVPLSYKNVQLLSQFVSPNTGRIYGRHITKLCNYQQKRVTKAIKRARQMGFMPFMYRETIFLKDPNLFDIRYTGDVNIAMNEPSNLVKPGAHSADEEGPDEDDGTSDPQ